MATLIAPTLASETVFHIGTLGVRNTLLMAWLAIVVIAILALALHMTGFKKIPGRFQTLMEMCIEGLYDFFGSILQDAKETKMFFPFIATIFIFILFGNWMGIIPGVGSIMVHTMENGEAATVPLFRSMNADVNMTLALSLIAMVSVQIFGFWALGFKGYAGKFFVAPWRDPLGTFLGFLEIVSEISKVISFTFRLFGNIFAGEVLLVVIAYLVPYIAPTPFLAMEVFVGVIQAFVFSLLTTVFLKMAMTGHGGHDEMEAHPA